MTTISRAAARPFHVHPLDPLGADEIALAWEILRAQAAVGPRPRVVSIALAEPAKEVVASHRPGDAVERAASVVLMDSAAGTTYEATVSLAGRARRGDCAAW